MENEEIAFDDFFKVYKGKLKFELFDGTMSDSVTRYSLEKSDAVAVLVYHVSEDAYLLVKQFRYPPYHHHIDPWLTEIVAGGIEENEEIQKAAEREVEEEVGYKPLRLQLIFRCYVSPGIMNERVSIFLAEVDETSKVNNGGGAHGEDEDIQLVRISKKEALHWINNQPAGDAKTIIAIQWHALITAYSQ